MAAPEIRPFAGPEHLPFAFGPGPGGVLLVHGFPATPAEMRPLAETLAADGWHTQGILLPGFGPNIPEMERFSDRDWLNHAGAAWKALASTHQPRVLVGYSMGGAIALHLAAALKPDRLILIAPFWRTAWWVSALVRSAHLLRLRLKPFKKANFSQPDLRNQMERIVPNIDLDDPEIQAYIGEQFTIPVRTLNHILHLGQTAYPKARQIQVPTLVLRGNADPLIGKKETERLIRALGKEHVTYQELEGQHDLVLKEHSNRQVGELVRSFLNGTGK